MPQTYFVARPERIRPFAYFLGLDLGQSADYTALAIIEEPVWMAGRWASPATMDRSFYDFVRAESDRARPPNPPLSVRHLERFELGTRYTDVVERVREMAYTPPLAGKPCCLLVDKGGVGAAVLDTFEHAGIRPTAITIHGGSAVSYDPQRRGYRSRSGTSSPPCRSFSRMTVSR